MFSSRFSCACFPNSSLRAEHSYRLIWFDSGWTRLIWFDLMYLGSSCFQTVYQSTKWKKWRKWSQKMNLHWRSNQSSNKHTYISCYNCVKKKKSGVSIIWFGNRVVLHTCWFGNRASTYLIFSDLETGLFLFCDRLPKTKNFVPAHLTHKKI